MEQIKDFDLTIHCDMEKGQITVKGPIHLKLLCIKVLADAIHIVSDQPQAVPKPDPANGKAPTNILTPPPPNLRLH